MESNYNLVIKAKYGDTLRRFNADISDDGERLGLNMAGLRAKIIGLFNFPVGTEFTLTYIDEDDDVVTLVDDDDLYDVMSQNLKFLRIDVQLNTGNKVGKQNRSSFPPPPVPVSAADPLGGAVSEALSKLSVDVASKVAFAGPVLVDLVECLSKMGQSYLGHPVSKPESAAGSSMPVATDLEPSSDVGLQAVLPKLNDETRGVDVPAVSDPGSTDSSMPNATDPSPSSDSGLGAVLPERNDATRGMDVPAVSGPGSIDLNVADTLCDANLIARKKGKSVSFDKSASYSTKIYYPSNRIGKHPSNGSPFRSVATNPVVPPRGKRVVGYFTFHKGIKCDGCGVVPIAGPRFKSKVKDDYDLCITCFSILGKEKVDYIRMDRAVPSIDHIARALPHVSRNCALKSARPELDNDFILDINFMDRTAMAPSTPFSKIWRMRNSGTATWFPGMQVVWIGGHKLRRSTSVDIKVPADGVPIDGELDIAVDFTAPEFPGKYHSYWMMATQAGIKFGQHLTLLVNVDASLKDTNSDNNLEGLDLNFPPQISLGISLDELSTKEPTLKTRDVSIPLPKLSSLRGFSVPAFPDLVIDPSEAAPGGASQMPSPSAPCREEESENAIGPSETPVSLFSVPAIDPSEAASGGASQMSYPCAQSEEEESENAAERILLKQLEEMGFKQVNLNKEILRRNGYDLEKSIDDLLIFVKQLNGIPYFEEPL